MKHNFGAVHNVSPSGAGAPELRGSGEGPASHVPRSPALGGRGTGPCGTPAGAPPPPRATERAAGRGARGAPGRSRPRWRRVESESSVSYQPPLALSECVRDMSQTCEISLCVDPIHV